MRPPLPSHAFFRISLSLVLAISLGALFSSAHAQIQHGGTPYSFQHSVAGSAPVEAMPPVDEAALRAEDRNENSPRQPRFGKAIDVTLGIDNAGRWTDLSEGGRLWRLRIASRNAQSLNFIFDRFQLPRGAELFIYNNDESTVLGAFTAANNKSHGRFSTLPLEGSTVTLEYYVPPETDAGRLRLSTVVHAYRDLFSASHSTNSKAASKNQKLFGESASCHINVNCSEGDPWDDEKGSIAMVLTGYANRICSGSLMRSVPSDTQDPYFLTAAHCVDVNGDEYVSNEEESDAEVYLFWFNYQSSTCANPSTEPDYNGVSGSILLDYGYGADYALLELTNSPPVDYGTYYNGWSNSTSPPRSSATVMSHPRGDIKKISVDDETAVSTSLEDNDENKGLAKESWGVGTWDKGTLEPGSSGSPLYNSNERVIGVTSFINALQSTCDVSTYHGKFSTAWSNGLSSYLDPGNTNWTAIDGEHGRVDVVIDGPTYMNPSEPGTWSVEDVYGTDGRYSIDWYYIPSSGSRTLVQSGGSSYSRDAPDEDFDIAAKITYNGQQGSDEVQVTVSSDGGGGLLATDPDPDVPSSASSSPGEPDTYALHGTQPNPFRNDTVLRFDTPETADVIVTVHDLVGREVARLVDRVVSSGSHRVSWNPDGLSSGMYLIRIQANDFTASHRAVLVK